jgi:sugar/nucleoside kinase (ribokinase family)
MQHSEGVGENYVYLYGMISPSTVYILDESFTFPQPNQYAEIKQSLPSVGGEAVNSAIMLGKFGIKTKLDGIWLNRSKAEQVLELLKPYSIDVSRLTLKDNSGTEEIVITDKKSRTIFGNYAKFFSTEQQWNMPDDSDIRHAALISLDPYLKDESRRVAELCVQHQRPYVTIDCEYNDFMAQHAAAVIISHELREKAYSDRSMTEVFDQYQQNCKGLVIFTFGSDELWYARRDQKIKTFQPYKIAPIDTTGAGDSFRAGIIYGLLESWNDEATIEFASAVAACVCLTIPHALNAPGLDGVLRFMKEYKRK